MSILTNQHFDIPSYENGFEYARPGKPDTRRRFFQSVARWDARYERVMVPKYMRAVLPSSEHRRQPEMSPSDYDEVVSDEQEDEYEEVSEKEEDLADEWESDEDEASAMVE